MIDRLIDETCNETHQIIWASISGKVYGIYDSLDVSSLMLCENGDCDNCDNIDAASVAEYQGIADVFKKLVNDKNIEDTQGSTSLRSILERISNFGGLDKKSMEVTTALLLQLCEATSRSPETVDELENDFFGEGDLASRYFTEGFDDEHEIITDLAHDIINLLATDGD